MTMMVRKLLMSLAILVAAAKASTTSRSLLRGNAIRGLVEGDDVLKESQLCVKYDEAVAFVEEYGDVMAGNVDCATEADPDSCGGGCCRFGPSFMCDETNQWAYLPCVCNRNTNNAHVDKESTNAPTLASTNGASNMYQDGEELRDSTDAPTSASTNGASNMYQDGEELRAGGNDSTDAPTQDSTNGGSDVYEDGEEMRDGSILDGFADLVGLGGSTDAPSSGGSESNESGPSSAPSEEATEEEGGILEDMADLIGLGGKEEDDSTSSPSSGVSETDDSETSTSVPTEGASQQEEEGGTPSSAPSEATSDDQDDENEEGGEKTGMQMFKAFDFQDKSPAPSPSPTESTNETPAPTSEATSESPADGDDKSVPIYDWKEDPNPIVEFKSFAFDNNDRNGADATADNKNGSGASADEELRVEKAEEELKHAEEDLSEALKDMEAEKEKTVHISPEERNGAGANEQLRDDVGEEKCNGGRCGGENKD